MDWYHWLLCILSLSVWCLVESSWSPGLTPSGAKFKIYWILNEQLAFKQVVHLKNCRCDELASSLRPLLSTELQESWLVWKGPPAGWLHYPYMNMVFYCTRMIFIMLRTSVIDGHCLTFQQSVHVSPHLLVIMPSLVLMVVIPLFIIMKSQGYYCPTNV